LSACLHACLLPTYLSLLVVVAMLTVMVSVMLVLLRNLLCEVALKSRVNNKSILGQVLTMDALLWKDARSACQQLFTKCMLLDPLCKKMFSVELVKVCN
jgi:hypothetical protein